MISLLALIIRVALLAVFTFGFVVLYEHGFANYPDNARQDFNSFVNLLENNSPKNLQVPNLQNLHLPFGTPQKS